MAGADSEEMYFAKADYHVPNLSRCGRSPFLARARIAGPQTEFCRQVEAGRELAEAEPSPRGLISTPLRLSL